MYMSYGRYDICMVRCYEQRGKMQCEVLLSVKTFTGRLPAIRHIHVNMYNAEAKHRFKLNVLCTRVYKRPEKTGS